MPFRYTIDKDDSVVFRRSEQGCGRFLFVFAGLLFTSVGVVLFLFSDSDDLLVNVMTYLFPLFGLTALTVGVRLPAILRKSTPDSLTFDNANGRIAVQQQASDVKIAYIYYDEIEDFIIKVKKHETSGSSRKTSRTYYTFHVYLKKKDGGQWELLRFDKEELAKNEIEKLKTLIRLNQEPVRVEAEGTSHKYRLVNLDDQMEIIWRNPVGFGPLVLLIFSAVFVTIFYTIFQSLLLTDDLPVFGYVVMGFIAVVFVIVIGGNALKLVRNFRTVYCVAIDSVSLCYIERGLSGVERKKVEFPMKDLHAISFSFDTDESQRKIYIYTHEQFNKQNLDLSFSIASVKEVIDYYTSLVALDVQELTPVEALALENNLQRVIKAKGGVDIA